MYMDTIAGTTEQPPGIILLNTRTVRQRVKGCRSATVAARGRVSASHSLAIV